MESNTILPLKLNGLGYLEFTYKNVTYYILEGVLSLKGKAQGFSSQYDAKVYFVDRPMPNKRLREGLEYAMNHYLNKDFSIKRSFTNEIANEIFRAFDRVAKEGKK